jgi:hypothetical protein
MAHQVHNALFWAGTNDLWAWAEIAQVQAELYRAHTIEGLDTAFLSAKTRQNVTLRVGMSHACRAREGQEERVVCENAQVRFYINNSGPNGALYSVTWNDGRVETGGPVNRDLFLENFRAYAAFLRGDLPRPATRLIDSRPFVHLNNLAYIAARHITTIPSVHIQPKDDGHLDVSGLPEAIDTFVLSGRFPSEQSCPWAAPGGTATQANLSSLQSVIQAMA